MKIEINDNVRMLAALEKVEEGNYFDALCLFARVDSYESMLNQIGCLCHLGDVGYAVELYRRLLAKFYFTHNCCHDLNKISEHTVQVLSQVDKQFILESFEETRLSADDKLLGNFDVSDDEFYDDYLDDYPEEEEDRFCDVHSAEYFFKTISRLDDEVNKGHTKKSKKIIAELLDFDSMDESVLEGQMLLCLVERNQEKGAEFAERFATLSNVQSYRAVSIAVGILSGLDGHKETLDKLLVLLDKFVDQIPDEELLDYAQMVEGNAQTETVATKLAQILFDRHKNIGCEALRMSARIFCNMGLKKRAREAVLTLMNAVPWDSFAAVLLSYVDSGIGAKLDPSFSNVSIFRHLDVPTQLGVIAEYKLIQRMENAEADNGEECVFYTDDYKLLHCIANVCKTHFYRGNSEKFANDAAVLSTLLATFQPQSKEEFFAFAKQQLCSFMPEPSLQKDFLLYLIKHGFRGEVLMSTTKLYYPLDLSKLKIFDENFLNAFCLCAALSRVEPRRLQRAYVKIKSAVELPGESDFAAVHRLAYCMLAVAYKEFAHSSVADYFGEGEDALYLEYIKQNIKMTKPIAPTSR